MTDNRIRYLIFSLPVLFFFLFNASCSEEPDTGQNFPVIPFSRGDCTLTMTGDGLEAFDQLFPEFMLTNRIPNISVAVLRAGKLVMARSYSYTSDVSDIVGQPTSLFRIASLSKAVTAVAILKLHEEGQLDLDAKAFALIDHLQPRDGKTMDPRISDITIRQLLYHSGGWDRSVSGDPVDIVRAIALDFGVPPPADVNTIIRYMLEQPLDFDPGTQYAYSNFGYLVLGRIIEKVTGQNYESYVKTSILQPMDILNMRIGKTIQEDRAAGEVYYYDQNEDCNSTSVFTGADVAAPYGAYYIEAMDSHGGWLASAVDIMRFHNYLDGRGPVTDFLSATNISLMVQRPDPPLWEGTGAYYAMGWHITPGGSGDHWWHSGSLPGTTTLMVRTWYDDLSWVALCNKRNIDISFLGALDTLLWSCVTGTSNWPAVDLFSSY